MFTSKMFIYAFIIEFPSPYGACLGQAKLHSGSLTREKILSDLLIYCIMAVRHKQANCTFRGEAARTARCEARISARAQGRRRHSLALIIPRPQHNEK